MQSSVSGTKVIALLSRVLEPNLRAKLEVLGVHVEFADSISELLRTARHMHGFEVAFVPADVPSGEWFRLCRELTCLNPRPSILVSFTQNPFTVWSRLLDVGGFGVVSEPYTLEGLQKAIRGAVGHFHRNAASIALAPRLG